MNENLSFCDNNRIDYNSSTSNEECNYDAEYNLRENNKHQEPAFTPLYGKVTDINVIPSQQGDCIVSYLLTLQTTDQETVQFTLNANTYYIDCAPIDIGSELVGFYDSSAAIPAIYPPRYQIIVLAQNLPDRLVKADFFDCFLVSQDNQLELLITNNSYIVDASGKPYCGNISNKYMVVLYSRATTSIPAITQPNVIILL